MIYHPLFKLGVLLILFVPFFLLSRACLSGKFFTKRQSVLVLAGMLLLTCIIRVFYLRTIELDVDTSTWLSAALTFDRYPDKIWTLLNYSDSRPLTIFPLIAAGWLGVPFSYAGSEMVGLLLWLGTAAALYYCCLLVSSRRIALLVTASLCLLIATFSPVYAAYNSEHSSVLMVMMSVAALLSYVYGRWNSPWLALLAGLLLGSLVYAKFQNAPMGLITGLGLALAMFGKKAWTSLALLFTGALSPTVAINLYYLSLGKLESFWNAYFWNYFYYSYTTQFSSMPIERRFSMERMVSFLFISPYSGIYLAVLGLVVAVGIYLIFRRWSLTDVRFRWLLLYGTLLFLLSVYAVLQAGNDFQHYKLYLFPLLLLLVALVLAAERPAPKYLMIIFLAGSFLQTAVNVKYLTPYSKNADFVRLDGKVINSINRFSKPGDPILIWGWRDQLHVYTGRVQAYRNVHPFHFSMKSPLIPFWVETFLEDMEMNKPRLVIDAMLPHYSERGHLYLAHDKVPVVGDYIKRHYHLQEQVEGVRVFVRN